MNRATLAFTFGIGLAGALAAPWSAAAIVVNGDPIGSAYTIQNIDPGVTVAFTAHDPAPGNSRTIGELTLIVSHSNLVWLGFDLFENVAAARDSDEADGLRVLLDVRDTNGFRVNWADYHIRAVDYTVIDFSGLPEDQRPDERFHLSVAHFHDSPGGFGSAPLSPVGKTNNVSSLNFGLPSAVVPGDEFTVNDILVHERDFAGHQRSFRIEVLPSLPEPTTYALVAVAIGGIVALRRRSVGRA